MKKSSIILVDEDDEFVDALGRQCENIGLEVKRAANLPSAALMIAKRAPDILCVDLPMPMDDRLSFLNAPGADTRTCEVPLVVLTRQKGWETQQACKRIKADYVEKTVGYWATLEPILRRHAAGTLAESRPRPEIAIHGPLPRLARHLVETEMGEDFMERRAPHASQFPVTPDERDALTILDAVMARLGSSDQSNASGSVVPPASFDLENIPWVLCIDDDDDFSKALKIRLESHGAAVIRAFSGREGYRFAFTGPASVIVLDFNMPNGQGDYILGRLKDNPVTKDIPVVVITGTKDAVLKRRMLAMGAVAFFVKPVDFVELAEHLTKYINLVGLSKKPGVISSQAI